MSTFSSVVRKPGQKITPKVAPRRNIQRNAARLAAPTPLTPESLSQSPALESVDKEVGVIERDGLEHTPLETLSQEQSLTRSESQDEHRTNIAPSVGVSTSTNSVPAVQSRTNYSTTALTSSDNTIARDRSQSTGIPTVSTSSILPHINATRDISISTELQPGRSNRLPRPLIDITPENGKRKRKLDSHNAPAIVVSQDVVSTAVTDIEESRPRTRRTSIRRRQEDSQQADALLLNATTQAAAVSSLANSIDGRTRLLRPRQSSDLQGDAEPYAIEQTTGALISPVRQRRKNKSSGNINRVTSSVSHQVLDGHEHSRKRRSTPENAEEHEIDPSAVSMGELTKDSRLGKGWDLGRKLQENWSEVVQRRKDQMARNRERASEKGKQGRPVDKLSEVSDQQMNQVPAEVPVPSMTIVNGVITVTSESREVAFGSGLEQAAVQDAENALEDEKIYRYVHQGTLGRYAGLKRGTRWDDEATNLFYTGLRMFGTDFMMIANMFPGMTRKQIKLKYVKEERTNLSRIHENLKARQQIELDEYARMTNREFQDPQKVQDELDAEERRLRHEDEKRRAQEGFIHGDLESILQSGDLANNDLLRDEGDDPIVADNINRANMDGQGIVESAVAPKKRQRKAKETAKVKQSKKNRKPLEGVEERIGPIDEVER